MTPEVIQLHPDVEAILREVAAQPGSVLLRVPRQHAARTLREDRALDEVTSPASSSAERHLLAVYREEIAFALRQAAWHRIATDGPRAGLVYRRVTATRDVSVPTGREVSVAAAEASRIAVPLAESVDAIELLETLTVPNAREKVGAQTLLAAAHRVSPSINGRILAGSSFVLAGSYAAGTACFLDALRTTSSRELQAICWSNLAHALDEQGRAPDALRAVRRAVRLLEGYIPAEAMRLWLAIRLGEASEACSASSALDEACRDDARMLDEVVRRFAAGKEQGTHRMSPDQVTLARHTQQQCGDSAGRLLHALT